jgi:chromosome segregation ATPase
MTMSNKYLEAADEARRLLQGFSAVQKVADAFEEVGMLEQARTEAQAALDALQPQIADAKAQITTAEETMRAAELQAATLVAEAEDKAAKVATDAQAVLAEAQSKAQGIESGAAEVADRVVSLAHANADEAIAKRDALAAETATLQAKLDMLKVQATALLG